MSARQRDYAHTSTARANRQDKANRLAAECYRRELRQIPAERVDRLHVEATVGLTRRASDETWSEAGVLLAARHAWDERQAHRGEKPCRFWTVDRYCGEPATGFYLCGHRCPRHAPAVVAGLPEPGQGAYRIETPAERVARRAGVGRYAFAAARAALRRDAGEPAWCVECGFPLHPLLVAAGSTTHVLCGPEPDGTAATPDAAAAALSAVASA